MPQSSCQTPIKMVMPLYQYAQPSVVTIVFPFLLHSLHEPTYNFGISIPA